MENITDKITTLNIYNLLKKYIPTQIPKTNTQKISLPKIYSSIINDSFIIIKYQESFNKFRYFKYKIISKQNST